MVSVKLDGHTGCYDLIVRTNDGNQIACVKESPASGDYYYFNLMKICQKFVNSNESISRNFF